MLDEDGDENNSYGECVIFSVLTHIIAAIIYNIYLGLLLIANEWRKKKKD